MITSYHCRGFGYWRTDGRGGYTNLNGGERGPAFHFPLRQRRHEDAKTAHSLPIWWDTCLLLCWPARPYPVKLTCSGRKESAYPLESHKRGERQRQRMIDHQTVNSVLQLIVVKDEHVAVYTHDASIVNLQPYTLVLMQAYPLPHQKWPSMTCKSISCRGGLVLLWKLPSTIGGSW